MSSRLPGGRPSTYHDERMSPVIVQGERLLAFGRSALTAIGASDQAAGEVAAHLVRATLSGHDGHGIATLPALVAMAERGEVVASAVPAIVREGPATAVFDAGGGFGQHAAAVAVDWCIERAGRCGVAAAAIRRTGDVGRLGDYAERAAAADMLAIVTAGAAGPEAGELMLRGGRTRFFGTNPWAFGVPGHADRLAFEASASTISAGEVLLARAKGEELPADCLYDRFGRPSTDPGDLALGGGLVPLGGEVAGHKGVGLAFASALFGGLAADGEASAGSALGGVFVAAIDPAAFGDAETYRERVAATLTSARSLRPGGGRSEVLLPGDAEARTRQERDRAGVRLPEVTWADLAALAERLSVPLPEPG